ncbi:S1 RNA-binding domain-containing protein [Agrilactobacillus fermenti]|uniref:CvfB family protein n=1 Tax=Agrilactobacillus fermenti TaxID=2586909 RepID=UPI003A5BDD58
MDINADLIGTIQSAPVTDQNDKAVFVQLAGTTLTVLKSELTTPVSAGETLTGFIYENAKHQLRLTPNLPKIRFDHYDFGAVTEVRRDLGVFVSMGLTDKDLVVSLDDLPEEKQLWPERDDRLMVTLSVDKKGRMWGKLADTTILKSVANRPSAKMRNENVTATVYQTKHVGSFVITDDYYLGFIHRTEVDVAPRLGQQVHARVIGLTQNNELNLSLKPRAYEEIGDDAAMVLAVLKRSSDHSIDFDDKSDPEAINDYFGISKGAFKRAIGHLLKAGLIETGAGKTKLK